MFTRVHVLGRGRVGGAAVARLAARGVVVTADRPDLVLLCVPDRAIGEVAGAVSIGPWIAHVSGATSLATLAPHTRRFSVHPLQTFRRDGDGTQFDGAWAAVSGESTGAVSAGHQLAAQLGLHPFPLDEAQRVLYHAGAVIASNYLVTIYKAAARLLTSAGAPPEALLPLMRRTIENGFDLTGPIARGDWDVVEAHLAAITEAAPELGPMYKALADITRR